MTEKEITNIYKEYYGHPESIRAIEYIKEKYIDFITNPLFSEEYLISNYLSLLQEIASKLNIKIYQDYKVGFFPENSITVINTNHLGFAKVSKLNDVEYSTLNNVIGSEKFVNDDFPFILIFPIHYLLVVKHNISPSQVFFLSTHFSEKIVFLLQKFNVREVGFKSLSELFYSKLEYDEKKIIVHYFEGGSTGKRNGGDIFNLEDTKISEMSKKNNPHNLLYFMDSSGCLKIYFNKCYNAKKIDKSIRSEYRKLCR